MALYRCMNKGGGGSGVKYYETTIANAQTDTEYTIDCGFAPKQIFIYSVTSATANGMIYYDENISTTQYLAMGTTSSTLRFDKMQDIGNTSGNVGAITYLEGSVFKFAPKNRNVITAITYIKVLG